MVWLEVVRALGVPVIPASMFLSGLYNSRLLGRGTSSTSFRLSVYHDSRCVTAVAKLAHEGFRQSLLKEVSRYQQLQGIRGVPRVLGVSVEPAALVTTYHGSLTLLQALTGGRLPASLFLEALQQVVSTLMEIHSRNLVHNDLKYTNVLINLTNEGVLEATVIHMKHMTAAGEMPYNGWGLRCEDYPYLAPELVLGGRVSPVTDVYSVGWMLQGLLQRMLGRCQAAHQLRQMAAQCLGAPAHRPSLRHLRHHISSLINRLLD